MKTHFIMSLALVVIGIMPAGAGERVDLMFTNSLDQEIVSIRVKYATPYDEPRRHSFHVFLPPDGGEYRVGVQGATLPERIFIDLATKTFDFADLSGIDPTNDMHIEVAHEDGRPILRRRDSDGNAVVQGEERDFLTDANRPNAIDRDFLTRLKTWDGVRGYVAETVAENLNEMDKTDSFDIEAGPIWNNEHALERCPEVLAEWNAANDREAHWTGQWKTTVPGTMSVCDCVAGTAGFEKTLFEEDAGWGKTLYFPVFWKEWFGAARVQAMDKDIPEEGIGFDLRFRIPEAGFDEMLDSLLSDLRVDGFRPWRFAIRTWDKEKDEGDETELVLHENDGDKYDHQDALQERLFAAYVDGSLAEASAAWVKEAAFDKAKAGEEPPATQGVMVMFSKGTFEAVFIPDGRMLME